MEYFNTNEHSTICDASILKSRLISDIFLNKENIGSIPPQRISHLLKKTKLANITVKTGTIFENTWIIYAFGGGEWRKTGAD